MKYEWIGPVFHLRSPILVQTQGNSVYLQRDYDTHSANSKMFTYAT